MKEFVQGIIVFIASLLVTIPVYIYCIPYCLGYAFYMSITLKDWKAFFVIWWRIIDGFFAAIGHILRETAIGVDITWNVFGEGIEDLVTTEEETLFRKKGVTVSSAVGDLEIRDKLIPRGKWFTKVLNIAFNQKQHAIDSYNFMVAKNKLRNQYFQER
jgi:hypothetical protein